jgi:hypothetical protein
MSIPRDPSAAAEPTLSSLRPLSLGELLDRAFSICFRHLLVFTSLIAVVVVPSVILQYFAMRPYTNVITQMMQTTATGGMPSQNPAPFFQALTDGIPYFLALITLTVLFFPLSNAAVVSGVSRAYLGMPVRFADCYGDAVRRWPLLLGLMLLWFFTGFVLYVGLFIVMFVLFATVGAIAATMHLAGIIIASIIGVAAIVGFLLLAMDIYLAAAFSFVAVVLENAGATAAYASGFRRVFGTGQFWRSVAIAAALFGIIIGLEIVALVVSGLSFELTHSFVTNYVVNAILAAFIYPFTFAVVAVAYYDVRIRREGFDLQMLAARLGPQAPQ